MHKKSKLSTRIFIGLALGALFAVAQTSPTMQGAGPNRGGGQQGGPGGPGGGPGGSPGGGMRMQMPPVGPVLLIHPDVVRELNLSQDQIEATHAFMEQNRPPMGQSGPGGPPNGASGQGGQGGLGQAGEQMQRKFEAFINQNLTQQQRNRFHQIELQVQGPRAFMMPEVGEKLSLSSQQREAIRKILDANRPPMPGGPPNGGPANGGRGGQGDLGERARRIMNQIMEVLSQPQQAKYRELIGNPFRLSPMGGRPGGRPGRQNGGSGGPGTPPPSGDFSGDEA
jgi:hypothetical protein